jgi:hypothetical protein
VGVWQNVENPHQAHHKKRAHDGFKNLNELGEIHVHAAKVITSSKQITAEAEVKFQDLSGDNL